MAKKHNIPTSEIPGMWFIKNPFRGDLNSFSFDLDEVRKTVKHAHLSYTPEIYEVQFWLKKPAFKKLTQSELKKLNLL